MHLLEVICNNRHVIRKLTLALEAPQKQTLEVVVLVVPVLARAILNQTHQPGDLNALLQVLHRGNHQRYIDQPDNLSTPASTVDGNALLGDLFGGKDISRNIAAYVARQTGVASSRIKAVLPALANLTIGAVSKHVARVGSTAPLGGTLVATLESFLNSTDGDAVLMRLLKDADKTSA